MYYTTGTVSVDSIRLPGILVAGPQVKVQNRTGLFAREMLILESHRGRNTAAA